MIVKKCQACGGLGFVWTSTPDGDNVMEPCPNGCKPGDDETTTLIIEGETTRLPRGTPYGTRKAAAEAKARKTDN